MGIVTYTHSLINVSKFYSSLIVQVLLLLAKQTTKKKAIKNSIFVVQEKFAARFKLVLFKIGCVKYFHVKHKRKK